MDLRRAGGPPDHRDPPGHPALSGAGATVGLVSDLWRFPVKSFSGERVRRAFVGPFGIIGDRRYAVLDADDAPLTHSQTRVAAGAGRRVAAGALLVFGGVALINNSRDPGSTVDQWTAPPQGEEISVTPDFIHFGDGLIGHVGQVRGRSARPAQRAAARTDLFGLLRTGAMP